MKKLINKFIKKFSAIPKSDWCVGRLHDGQGRCCALGHCLPKESRELDAIFQSANLQVSHVNDGDTLEFSQLLPKSRILAALRYIKKKI